MTPRLIAHRGLWLGDVAKQNRPEAIEAALRAGFGVELDVWPDHAIGYRLRVGHDREGSYPIPDAIVALGAGEGPILWNVKGAGCEHGLRLVYARHPAIAARSYVFDHDYRDTDPELPQRFPEARYLWRMRHLASTRAGDGWWCDDADLPDEADQYFEVSRDRPAPRFYVSPELHGRVLDLGFARRVLDAGAWLCTDHAPFLAVLYGEQRDVLHPVEPWW